jgi:hypothetical protein
MSERGLSLRAILGLLLAVPCACLLLLAGYEIRHAEVVVRLRPAYADNERIPLEIGDTLAVADGDLLFPGLFGHYYVTGLRPWHFGLRTTDSSGTVERGTIRATAGGSLGIEAAYRRPFPLGKLRYRNFNVLPEPIDTILVTLSRDTIAVGDTLEFRIEVRGRSGRSIWGGDLPLASPPMIDLAYYGLPGHAWHGRGVARAEGVGPGRRPRGTSRHGGGDRRAPGEIADGQDVSGAPFFTTEAQRTARTVWVCC